MRSFYLLLALTWLLSCSRPSSLPADALRRYVSDPENGLVKNLQVGTIDVSCIFKPTDQLVLQELESIKQPASETIDSLRALYDENLFFVLNISKNNREIETFYHVNTPIYASVREYLNSGIGNRVFAVVDADTIPISGHVYSGTVTGATKTSLLISFPADQLSSANKFTIILRDNVLGLGDCQFTFQTIDVSTTPKIKF